MTVPATHGLTVDPDTGTVYGTRWGNPVGHVGKTGYVKLYAYDCDARTCLLAHRVIWEAVHGPIPAGMQINHKNGVKDDNRLENLELCTPGENIRHAVATGLIVGKRGHHKLTEDEAVAIRSRYRSGGVTQRALASEYAISQACVSDLIRGKTWAGVA